MIFNAAERILCRCGMSAGINTPSSLCKLRGVCIVQEADFRRILRKIFQNGRQVLLGGALYPARLIPVDPVRQTLH